MVRCFAAVSLPAPLLAEAVAVLAELRVAVTGVKWVRPDALHATLKFFGEIPEAELPPLVDALRRAARTAHPAPISLVGAGTFPPRGAPRVVWLGMEDADGKLAALHATVDRAAESRGFAPERRRFHPHLTLGRVRRGQRPQGLPAALEPLRSRRFGACTIGALTLFRSELLPDGARYRVIERWALA